MIFVSLVAYWTLLKYGYFTMLKPFPVKSAKNRIEWEKSPSCSACAVGMAVRVSKKERILRRKQGQNQQETCRCVWTSTCFFGRCPLQQSSELQVVSNDSIFHTLNWFYLSVTFQDCKSAIQMFAAHSTEKIRILMQTSGEKYWRHWTLQKFLVYMLN